MRLEALTASNLPTGPRAQGRPGDFLLSTPLLRLVIGRADGAGPRSLSGVILDAAADAWVDDPLRALGLVLQADGTEVPTLVRSVEPELSGAAPAVRIVHESADRTLMVVTQISVTPGERWASITSRVENKSSTSRRVRLGDRLEWHGGESFVSGSGFSADQTEVAAPWLAHSGRRLSAALAFPGTDARVRSREREMGAREQTAFGPELRLAPGQSARHGRRLVVAPGSLDVASEHVWRAAGVEPGLVEVSLASEVPWAVLEARDAAGRPVVSARVRGSKAVLFVPSGSYQIVLKSPGGTDRARVKVSSRGTARVELIPPRPARISYQISDDHGAPMPARLIVSGLPPTINPDLGPHHSAAGAANVACTATGTGSLELPPGRYSVLATRGPEYEIDEHVVEVSATQGATIRPRLARVVDTKGWLAADLHLHADPSGDSEVSLADRVTSLVAEGVELAVATDHNHVTDYAPAVRQLGMERRVSTRPGVEVTTSNWGHFNVYPYPTTAALPALAGTSPAAFLSWLRGAVPEALIQVNHPRMGDIGYFNQIRLDARGASATPGASLDFDLIEVWNGFDLAKPSVLDEGLAEWMRLILAGRRYTAVGNSDSHRIAYQWAGYPRTYVRVEDESPEGPDWSQVVASLRAGRVVVTSGPFIDLRVDGESPGALVKTEQGTVGVELEVRAPAWIGVERAELFLDGKLAMQVDASSPEREVTSSPRARLRFVGGVPVAADGFLVVVVRGTTSLGRVLPGTNVVPVAFTNPVFIDADGDGRYTPPGAAK